MVKVDKLDHIHGVAHILQHICPDGIGEKCGHPLLDDAVLQKNVQIAALADAAVHFVLAAGNGENEIRLFGDGVVQRKVRGHIAGVKSHDHVDVPVCQHIPGHIRSYEFQSGVAVLPGDLPAALHHIFLDVIADDGGIHLPLNGEVIVEDKGQIGFTAAKIQNGDVVFPVILKGVIDELNEAVDLLVLVVFGPDDFEIGGKDTQIHQCRDVFSLFEDIFLLSVVALHLSGQGKGSGGVPLVAAVTLHGVLDGLCIRYHQRLAIAALQLAFQNFQQLLAGHIPVKGLVVPETFQLIAKLAFQQHRPDGHLLVVRLVDGLAEHRLGKKGKGGFKIG